MEYSIKRAINKVKQNSRLEFSINDLKLLIDTLEQSIYKNYYELVTSKNNSNNTIKVYLKDKSTKRTLLFLIQIDYQNNQKTGMISYGYGANYNCDCLLLKWLCDLLMDKRYITKQ